MDEILRWFFGARRSVPQLLDLEAKLKQDLQGLELQVQEQYYIAGRAYSEKDQKTMKAALRKKNQLIAQHIKLTGNLKTVQSSRRARELQLPTKSFGASASTLATETKVIPTMIVHPPPEDSIQKPVTDSVVNLLHDINSRLGHADQDSNRPEEEWQADGTSNNNQTVVVDIEKRADADDDDVGASQSQSTEEDERDYNQNNGRTHSFL